MWRLTKIEARNLCTFREMEYTPSQGVTTLVFGDNRDNESQRSNGSGKSALIEDHRPYPHGQPAAKSARRGDHQRRGRGVPYAGC